MGVQITRLSNKSYDSAVLSPGASLNKRTTLQKILSWRGLEKSHNNISKINIYCRFFFIMSSKLKYEDNMFYCSLFPLVYTPRAKNKSMLFTVVGITRDALTQIKMVTKEMGKRTILLRVIMLLLMKKVR